MAVDWDLYDYDPWDEWSTGARERMTDDAMMHMVGERQDRAWAEEDEPRYIAALLYAGAEPEDDEIAEHGQWQDRAAEVLMRKYYRHWWFEWTVGERVHPSPEYRQKARTCRRDVQLDELRKFYTWVCKQRREPWTDNIVPESR